MIPSTSSACAQVTVKDFDSSVQQLKKLPQTQNIHLCFDEDLPAGQPEKILVDLIKAKYLNNVTTLDLSGNQGLSTLPEEVRQLQWLSSLDIRLSSIRTLPVWLGELTSIENFQASCGFNMRLPSIELICKCRNVAVLKQSIELYVKKVGVNIDLSQFFPKEIYMKTPVVYEVYHRLSNAVNSKENSVKMLFKSFVERADLLQSEGLAHKFTGLDV